MSAELDAAVAWLQTHNVGCCLIGGAALSVRGYARYTDDIDLLVMDTRVLAMTFWRGGPVPIRVAPGDAEAPLAGVVELPGKVEVVVGKGHAAQFALSTATDVVSRRVRAATPLGLTLLKLEAGGPVDIQDIHQLVSVQRTLGTAGWVQDIAAHVPLLSVHARDVWTRVAPHLTP